MQYLALATDYDETIAVGGRVDEPSLAALHRVRQSGRRLIMVTGRELDDLIAHFPHCDLFDRIVAENGALLFRPDTQQTRLLAPPPPPEFLQSLQRQKVPISIGRSIVATVEPFEHTVLAAIRELGLEWHVIFNKGAVMALPAGVTKATGLSVALEELDIAREQVVGVGDAENDQAFLRACGLAAAVDNALPSVKAIADLVTIRPRGDGVRELIDRLIADELRGVLPKREHHWPKTPA